LKVLLLTGERGVGKSTYAQRVRQRVSMFDAIRFKGYETGFQTVQEGVRQLVCHPTGSEEEPFCVAEQRVLPYRRFLPYPEAFGRMARLLDAVTEGAYIDEIGFLETLDDRLQQSILGALARSALSIIVIRLGDYPFLKKVKALYRGSLFELTIENRDRSLEESVAKIKRIRTPCP